MLNTTAYDLHSSSDLWPKTAAFFVLVLTIVGLWIRITGLGERPLAQDEYYFVEAVHNILEFGVPRFPSGGYYFRGIPQQYLTALSIQLFGDGPFAYRLQSALFSVGTLVMAYFLGRQFLNRSWSIVLVAILAFSSWEIEFSRFARMYAAFEFVTICFFWSLYRHSFNARWKKRYITVALAVTALFTHALGVFLALLLFLPLPAWFDRDWRKTLSDQRLYIAISSMVLFIGVFRATHSFRFIGVSDHLPRDFISPLAKTPHWLSFGTGLFGDIVFLSIAALAGACLVGGYVLYINRYRPNADNEEHLLGGLIVLAVCCAVVHQFAMSAMIILVVASREPKLLVKRPYTHLILLLVVIASFWFTMLFFNQAWIEAVGLGNIVRSYLRSFRLAFFAFPDLYTPVFRAWADSVPVLGSLLGVAAAWQIVRIRKLSLASIVRNPVTPLVIVVLAMGLHPPLYIETRYSQFLYPLALCVGLLSAGYVGEIARRRYNLNEGQEWRLPYVCLHFP
ncbi:MAG: glycosyltransferase family 39 protein [Deltaproteobacteria bacterium]|nr:glycosyltransferase family 39 protein [Deltaproteobacteria bacterium]